MKSKWAIALAALAVCGFSALADEAKPKKNQGGTDPKGVSLELRLVAKKVKYKLDLGGKTTEEFLKILEESKQSGEFPAPPTVDFSLELRNTGKKDLQIHIQGDANVVLLDLKGKGAVAVTPLRAFTADFKLPKTITIEAGKSYKFPAYNQLVYGFRGVAQQAYWTQAGDYTVTATFKTAISPKPEDAKDAEDGFGMVTVTSAPLKIKVEAAK